MGKKIGRNDPCPCGSGQKYKNCCIKHLKADSHENPLIPPDLYQLIIMKYFSEGHIDLNKEKGELNKLIFTKIIETHSIQKSSDVDFIKNYLNACEFCIKEIAQKYSIYEMLYWSRRLAPKNIFEVSDLSVMLYREIQTLCIYKYGNNIEKIKFDKTNTIYPEYLIDYYNQDYIVSVKKIRDEKINDIIVDVLTDTIRIEILSYLFLKATQKYRIMNKGGILKIDYSNYLYYVETNKNLDFLIEMYDRRLKRVNLFSITGAYIKEKDFQWESYFYKSSSRFFSANFAFRYKIYLSVGHFCVS